MIKNQEKDLNLLLKEFDSEKSYFWSELAEMTPVCACCGSENIKEEVAR